MSNLFGGAINFLILLNFALRKEVRQTVSKAWLYSFRVVNLKQQNKTLNSLTLNYLKTPYTLI